jgi:BirA family biotin operon repressor/biotin-[acetyl-CoA-carboxylase] ligase
MDTNDTLFEKIIHDGLSTTFIGQKMALLPTVHSTNQYLKESDTDSTDNGFVIIADEQTNGRGRRSRTFISPKREGVYFSILLKLDKVQQDIRLLTICAAVAVSKAIEKSCGIRAEIKWVNDIYCNGKKVCGILTEAILSGELQELSTVIIGIGINTGNVPLELGDIATSIQEATGIRGIRNQLVAEALNQFETVYLDYTERDKVQDIIGYYKSRLFIIGKQILVSDNTNNYIATVLGIDDMGALIVKDDYGDVQNITTGEIKLKW